MKFIKQSAAMVVLLAVPGMISGAPAVPQKGKQPPGVRLKNLARIEGVRSNQLLGYGLVVGLPGTGDSRSKLASRSIKNLLSGLGQTLPLDSNARNIAAVLVTAELPAFAGKGHRLNVMVSSIGDARSLEGGVLIQTPLVAGNKETYAVAQGVVTTGGRTRRSGAGARGKTVGMVLDGASVERAVKADFAVNRRVRIQLRSFDFATMEEVRKALLKAVPGLKLQPDGGALLVEIPKGESPYGFVAKLEEIRVVPKYAARVIINERTGTVVMGGDVRVDPVSISRGGLQLFVAGGAKAKAGTGVTKELQIKYGKKSTAASKPVTRVLSGSNVAEIVQGLNAIGAGVKDIIAILEALKKSGALHARLIVI